MLPSPIKRHAVAECAEALHPRRRPLLRNCDNEQKCGNDSAAKHEFLRERAAARTCSVFQNKSRASCTADVTSSSASLLPLKGDQRTSLTALWGGKKHQQGLKGERIRFRHLMREGGQRLAGASVPHPHHEAVGAGKQVAGRGARVPAARGSRSRTDFRCERVR